MFKFDFNLENADEEAIDLSLEDNAEPRKDNEQTSKRSSLMVSTVEDLIKNLPSLITYSPLRIPLSDDQSLTLIRRDLFDARFQLISESLIASTSEDLNFIDAPSDLVPGVYEGGLKTWECSADLARYLNVAKVPVADKHMILEVGCGTAIPSLYLLRYLFYKDPAFFSTRKSSLARRIHLQDYNLAVLRLVTLPNIILTWYASPASDAYRTTQSPLPSGVNPAEPGELSLTPELLWAFRKSLKQRHIDLQFFSGSWSDMNIWIREHQFTYDLVLTSETIYRPSSLPSLIFLLRSSCTIRNVTIMDDAPANEPANPSLQRVKPASPSLCLVAAKVIYFGVGGCVDTFENAVREVGGQLETVLEDKGGVSRRIMQVTWNQ
ncbi:hypothetical protein K439DRAFT_1654089 [Ramaria rubella]|nr:hypothetical protein K439DRAFT_1654089 [Ramaria rubella]